MDEALKEDPKSVAMEAAKKAALMIPPVRFTVGVGTVGAFLSHSMNDGDPRNAANIGTIDSGWFDRMVRPEAYDELTRAGLSAETIRLIALAKGMGIYTDQYVRMSFIGPRGRGSDYDSSVREAVTADIQARLSVIRWVKTARSLNIPDEVIKNTKSEEELFSLVLARMGFRSSKTRDLVRTSPLTRGLYDSIVRAVVPADRGLDILARSTRAKEDRLNRGQLGRRFHQIKDRGRSSGPQDRNYVDTETGDVYDTDPVTGEQGEYIGNVFNDF